MILTGSSSRLLGVRGVLGLIGMAALMLPVNATWAQKAEEPQEVDVVAKSIVDVISANDAPQVEVHAISAPDPKDNPEFARSCELHHGRVGR